jgi:transcriptional regulator GlxA family with amidase domain
MGESRIETRSSGKLPRQGISHTDNTPASPTPLSIGCVIFPGFQALDVFGPLDALNVLSYSTPLTLSLIGATLSPISTHPAAHPTAIGQTVVPTHTFASAPHLDVLLIPGGYGTRGSPPGLDEAIDFIRARFPELKYMITVCTGSRLAARSGVLDGLRATTNKRAWLDTREMAPAVKWVAHARWVVDGKCWTSAGVSAGIDVVLAWMEKVYGREKAEEVAGVMEYERHEDSKWDPFAVSNGLPADE